MILDVIQKDNITKPEIEQVEKLKKEYTILGTYLLTAGLKLFSFNSQTNEIKEVIIKKGDTINIAIIKDFGWIAYDPENLKATIDSKLIYFEKLNYNNAVLHINKCRKNNKEICNLKNYNEKAFENFKNLF